ncbi:MAG: hypothetical protein MMC33_009254, partial [Icmadophila ericetorum]|nr:hypothetical protein [Icmadophila ericetorum]
MSDTAKAQAAAICEEGNAFYKAGEIMKDASALSPDDPSPFSNLSAVYYELGQYEKCIVAAQKALELSGDGEKRMVLVYRLSPRLTNANLHLCRIEDATKALSDVPTGHKSSTKYQEIIAHATATKFAPEAKLEYEKSKSNLNVPCKKTYHFSLNDINPNALARDIILLCLLQDYSDLPDDTRSGQEGKTILSTLFFIYTAAVMPQYAFEILQEAISRICKALISGSNLPACIAVLENDKALLLTSLRSWQGELTSLYTTTKILTLIRNDQESQLAMEALMGPGPMEPKAIREKKAFYVKAGLAYPPNTLNTGVAQLSDYVSHFFVATAKAIHTLKGRLQIEILLGDGSATMEQLRYDTLKHRDSSFPRVFDVVHLSNVPVPVKDQSLKGDWWYSDGTSQRSVEAKEVKKKLIEQFDKEAIGLSESAKEEAVRCGRIVATSSSEKGMCEELLQTSMEG